LAQAFREADPGTEKEVAGLVPSDPDLRPADILTRAAHAARNMAVDVMVKAPTGSVAEDGAESGKRNKLARYGHILPELEAQGIRYAPAVFTSYGREHADVTRMLKAAAWKVDRTGGEDRGRDRLRKWRRSVAVEIWRRAARLVHRCVRPPEPPDPSGGESGTDRAGGGGTARWTSATPFDNRAQVKQEAADAWSGGREEGDECLSG